MTVNPPEENPHHWQVKDGRNGWLLHKADTREELEEWCEQFREHPFLGIHAFTDMVVVPRYY